MMLMAMTLAAVILFEQTIFKICID